MILLVSTFPLCTTPSNLISCRNWRVHLNVSLHLLLLLDLPTRDRLISIQGLSSTVFLPSKKKKKIHIWKCQRNEISSCVFPLCGGKIHFMCDFPPNKPGVQMSSFLTAMNEDLAALRQWQKEEQLQVSKSTGMSLRHLCYGLNTQSLDPGLPSSL